MPNDRLYQVERNLRRLREQLANKEDTLTTIAPEERVRIKHQIEDLKREIQPFEAEYWQILADDSDELDSHDLAVLESQAEVVVAEIVEQVGRLQASQEYPDEVLQLLQKIYERVNQPAPTAAAKLKGTLSLLPPFVNVTYETEIDTEAFLRKYFPTFSRWSKSVASLLAKK